MPYRIIGPKGGVIVRAATLARLRKILAGLRRRFGRVRVVNLAKPKPFVMYDSITVTDLPATAVAVAGYMNGRWPTYPVLGETHPHAKRLSIAVSASVDADCLDVEKGDATPEQAPAWVKRQQARGVKKPCLYSSVSQWPKLITELERAGIKAKPRLLRRRQVKVWTAHYTGVPHLCSWRCGAGFGFFGKADATQYTDKALGRNLDASLCAPQFLP